MNELNIAILGCGKQAEKHIGGLAATGSSSIFLSDIEPGKARSMAEKFGVEYIDNPDEVFSDKRIDVVDICTPTPAHDELINKSLDSGKHFFCEKPLTENLEQAERIADKMAKTGLVGMVGYLYRFAPVFELGNSLFEKTPATGKSDVLGKITTAGFRLSGRGSHQPWKHMTKSGGGAVNEMLVHMIDLVIWYFGKITGVNILALDLFRPKRIINGREYDVDAEDFILVRLATESGVDIFCHADMVTPAFMQIVDVQGENGTFAGSIQPQIPSYVYLEGEAGDYPAGKTELDFGKCNLFELQMSHFVNAVKNGTESSKCTVGDSIQVMQAINNIKQEIELCRK